MQRRFDINLEGAQGTLLIFKTTNQFKAFEVIEKNNSDTTKVKLCIH